MRVKPDTDFHTLAAFGACILITVLVAILIASAETKNFSWRIDYKEGKRPKERATT